MVGKPQNFSSDKMKSTFKFKEDLIYHWEYSEIHECENTQLKMVKQEREQQLYLKLEKLEVEFRQGKLEEWLQPAPFLEYPEMSLPTEDDKSRVEKDVVQVGGQHRNRPTRRLCLQSTPDEKMQPLHLRGQAAVT